MFSFLLCRRKLFLLKVFREKKERRWRRSSIGFDTGFGGSYFLGWEATLPRYSCTSTIRQGHTISKQKNEGHFPMAPVLVQYVNNYVAA